MSAFEIGRGRPGDLDALERLENIAFDGDRLSRRSLRYFIGAQACELLVARARDQAADRLAGYALVGFRRGSQRARLYSIAVDPAASGRGLGKALMRACENVARARGCDRLGLEVRIDNAGAIALYRREGFAGTGREENYYEDGAAALRFEKRLAP